MHLEVRAAALTNFIETARSVGLDPYALLREARIHPEALVDPEHPLPLAPVAWILEESARRAHCDGFALLMAESRSLGSLGPLSLLLAHQPDARRVIDGLVRYQSLLAEALVLSHEASDGMLIVRADLADGRVGPQAIELAIGIGCRVIAAAIGGRWRPESVHFRHARPSDVRVHHRLFQCEIVFDSDFAGWVCSEGGLAAANNPVCDPELARHAERYLDLMLAERSTGSIEDRVRRAIYLMLPSGGANLERVAEALGLHPRALQRQLEKEGRPFAMLLNNVRRELAMRHLATMTQNVTAVALMTGYATPSAFTRWFRSQFGVAPAHWRAAFAGPESRFSPAG